MGDTLFKNVDEHNWQRLDLSLVTDSIEQHRGWMQMQEFEKGCVYESVDYVLVYTKRLVKK